MTRTLPLIALAAAAALAGCEPETVIQQPGGLTRRPTPSPMSATSPPPSIAASKAYRCKDNTLVYVDWLTDGSARVKKTRNEVGTAVPAGDTSLQGDAQAATITYSGQSCESSSPAVPGRGTVAGGGVTGATSAPSTILARPLAVAAAPLMPAHGRPRSPAHQP